MGNAEKGKAKPRGEKTAKEVKNFAKTCSGQVFEK